MMRVKFIFVLTFFLFVFLTRQAFAADFQVSGKIFDQNNNPLPQSTVVFVNESGKTVGAAVSDPSGFYGISVPQGTYNISADGPKGAGLQNVTFTKRTISSPVVINFTLKSPATIGATKPSLLQKLLPFLIGLAILLVLGICGFVFLKKKKVTPLSQPSSSN